MKELTCEIVLMAHMAKSDGEAPDISNEQLASHVTGCANCRNELKQMELLDEAFAGHTLMKPEVKLWLPISKQISRRTISASGWTPFALIGSLLVTYKVLEMFPERDLGLVFKVVPLAVVFSLFLLIRENPFRINSDLILER